MTCPTCGQPRRRYLHRCALERVTQHAVQQTLTQLVERENPIGSAIVSAADEHFGTGTDWAKTVYGEYYVKNIPIYAAIKLRADAVVRPPIQVFTGEGDDKKEAPNHKLANLLRMVNPMWTWGDLLRGTSTYLDLWGSAFWVMEKATPFSPPTEIWLARPDKMKVIPDKVRHVSGFRFKGNDGKEVFLAPDEVVWFRNFNPLDEFAGLAPIAPLRQSADMNLDAVTYNRESFRNGLNVDNLVIKPQMTMVDEEIAEFHRRLKQK